MSLGVKGLSDNGCNIYFVSILNEARFARKAELASTAATDVGMHGLLASQSCYHSVLPPSLCTLWTSSRFLHY